MLFERSYVCILSTRMNKYPRTSDHLRSLRDPGLSELVSALGCRDRVAGYTHDLYRYPARFPPSFVRAAIAAFTAPGDLVVDPFVGGGTSAVEAIASGRAFAGADINELAVFVAKAKTTLLSGKAGVALLDWSRRLEERTAARWATSLTTKAKHVPWPIRKTLELALESIAELPTPRLRRLARASLLRSAQWALDGRRDLPNRRQFLSYHLGVAERLVAASASLGHAASLAFGCSRHEVESKCRILHSAAQEFSRRHVVRPGRGHPRLIVTSPPYHGVHILYHRWQVQGRKETSAPYWLSGCRDGKPASHYTFGPRLRRNGNALQSEYFDNVLTSFGAIAELCGPDTILVQLVGFSDPHSLLSPYLEAMRAVGLSPVSLTQASARAMPFSRDVPNRKWYLDALQRYTASSREYLLIHRRSA